MGTWTPGPGPTAGNDVYVGDNTNETISLGDGDDIAQMWGGNDTVDGGPGADTIDGMDGNDIIHGGDGDDVLKPGNGTDQVFGDAGDDIIRFASDVGTATIDGGTGFDRLEIFHAGSGSGPLGLGSTMTGVELVYFQGFAGVLDQNILSGVQTIWSMSGGGFMMAHAGTVDLSAIAIPTTFFDGSLTFSNVSFSVLGSSGNDTITAPSSSGVFFNLSGLAGNDALNGGAASDSLNGGVGNDIVHGNDGNDTIQLFGGGTDTAFGDGGDDNFILTPDSNIAPETTPFTGNVDGGDGNDTLTLTYGTIGAGTTFSNIETTILHYTVVGPVTIAPGTLPTSGTLIAADGRLVLSVGGTTDLRALDMPLNYSLYGGGQATLMVTGSSGNDVFWMPSATLAPLTMNGGAGNDEIHGGAGADQLNGGTGINTLDGGGGDDVLVNANTYIGGAGFDTADFTTVGSVYVVLDDQSRNAGVAFGATFSSIEQIIGGNVSDTMFGDDGANTFRGGNGGDALSGNGGDDTFFGDAGDDTLHGGTGNDTLNGGAGVDHLFGDDGDDLLLVTGPSPQFLDGGTETDTVDFSAKFWVNVDLASGTVIDNTSVSSSITNVESVFGGSSTDTLRGDDNANILVGGTGDDTLEGRRGADTLNGGIGSDTITFTSATQGVVVDLLNSHTSFDGFETDVLISIENAVGTQFDDQLIGDANNNTFRGGAGADLIQGGDGNDTLDYSTSSGGVVVDLYTQVAFGGDATGDTISSIENVLGSHFDDVFYSNDAANTFSSAGGGFDTVSYVHSSHGVIIDAAFGSAFDGTVTDTIYAFRGFVGSNFNDVFELSGALSARVDGGSGSDVVDYAAQGHALYLSTSASWTRHPDGSWTVDDSRPRHGHAHQRRIPALHRSHRASG